MAAMRPDGGFVIKGRMTDALNFKIFDQVLYPAPIEEALGGHPNIRDISVRYYYTCNYYYKINHTLKVRRSLVLLCR